MFHDLISLVPRIRRHRGSAEWRMLREKFGPYGRLVDELTKGELILPEKVSGLLRTGTNRTHTFQVVCDAGCSGAAALTLLLPFQALAECPREARPTWWEFFEKSEDTFNGDEPLDGHPSLPSDLLGAIINACCQPDPEEAILDILAAEVAERLGYDLLTCQHDEVLARIKPHIRRHVDWFLSVGSVVGERLRLTACC